MLHIRRYNARHIGDPAHMLEDKDGTWVKWDNARALAYERELAANERAAKLVEASMAEVVKLSLPISEQVMYTHLTRLAEQIRRG